MVKDYYKILEVTPHASSVDVKKSYRRLALQYHPDKNFGNKIYEAKFKEITEAYKILSDLKTRQEYNIRRNIFSQAEKKKTAPPVTAAFLLNQAAEFRKKISALDPERMNKRALYQHIDQLLSGYNINILRQHNDNRLNKRFIDEILYCSRFLPLAHTEKICLRLTMLAGTDNNIYRNIYNFTKQAKRREFWDKYSLLIALAIAIIVCLFIYLIGESF